MDQNNIDPLITQCAQIAEQDGPVEILPEIDKVEMAHVIVAGNLLAKWRLEEIK